VASLASAAVQACWLRAAFIELPAHLRAIAMDKTGTMTSGSRKLFKLFRMGSHTEAELVARATALERTPPTRWPAQFRYAKRQGVAPAPAADVQVLKGKGLTGIFDGEPFWLSSHRYAVGTRSR
jgi:Cd2+/Zn2+-exporting ATPase